MTGTPKLRIKKLFGGAAVQEMEISLEEAKDQLAYFFTKEGSTNIKVSVEGQSASTYDELVKIVQQDRYKDKKIIDVGLFLSNEGHDSIWPKRPQPE